MRSFFMPLNIGETGFGFCTFVNFKNYSFTRATTQDINRDYGT